MIHTSNPRTMTLMGQLSHARDLLIGTMHGITPITNTKPENIKISAGARMAKIAALIDMIVIGAIGEKQPFFMREEWQGKTGYSEPMPMQMEVSEWQENLQLEIHEMHIFVMAMLEEANQILSQVTDEDLEKEYNFGPMGTQTLQWFLETATAMMYTVAGEIAVLKNIQGYPGYPSEQKSS